MLPAGSHQCAERSADLASRSYHGAECSPRGDAHRGMLDSLNNTQNRLLNCLIVVAYDRLALPGIAVHVLHYGTVSVTFEAALKLPASYCISQQATALLFDVSFDVWHANPFTGAKQYPDSRPHHHRRAGSQPHLCPFSGTDRRSQRICADANTGSHPHVCPVSDPVRRSQQLASDAGVDLCSLACPFGRPICCAHRDGGADITSSVLPLPSSCGRRDGKTQNADGSSDLRTRDDRLWHTLAAAPLNSAQSKVCSQRMNRRAESACRHAAG